MGPILALLDFKKPFIVECDAIGSEISVVRMQDSRPLAFFSQVLKGRNLSRSIYEREMLALIASIQKWWPYLVGQKFTFRTNHKKLELSIGSNHNH